MSRSVSIYVCQSCGAQTRQFFGRCNNCGEWNSIIEEKINQKSDKSIYKKINSDRPLILVGTHALFQKQAKFNKLGLIIIDEQHRFGVEQREALLNKSRSGNIHAHQLLMTATPIPRTLAMTAYSQLDISTLRHLPKGRKRVATHVIADTRRD